MAARNRTKLHQNSLPLVLLLAVLQSACGSDPGETPCETCNQQVSSNGGTGTTSTSETSAEETSSGGQSGVTAGGAVTNPSGSNATGGAATNTGGVNSGSGDATGGAASPRGDNATGGAVAAGGSVAATGGSAQSGGTRATGGSSTTQTSSDWPPTCTVVTGAVAKELVAKGALLVDVREPNEYSAGAVSGAVNIPLGSVSSRLAELDIDRPIVVYCRSGSRSKQAAAQLCDAGYAVYDMGAMSNWPQ